jgi:hypothetical protein
MLVILDDLVLDVGDYMDNHPGGRFLLSHNIGRDVSKFFYGGYALDGNISNKAKVHRHTNVARSQVDTLAIARLLNNQTKIMSENKQMVPTFQAVIKSRTQANSSTQTIQFNFVDDTQFPLSAHRPQNFYPDLQMIGKHYRISEAKSHTLHRHYTVANCLRQGAYDEYLRALKEDNAQIDLSKLKGANYQDSFSVSVKNYKKIKGLSMKLTENDFS